MALSQSDIECIRKTWALIVPARDLAAQVFYGRLFRIAPHTKALFRSDLQSQGRKLTDTLGFVVDHLHEIDQVTAAAEALAIRHVDYGVKEEDYHAVGDSLIWTFRNTLGGRFSEEAAAAWTKAYATLSEAMTAAAYPKGGGGQ
ncbi:MAG: globin domain-containing protein [Kiloniellales bacterium]